MATKPYRQNLTGAQGTTLTGAHGGTQQLGAAAQRRLQTGQPAPPPTAQPVQRTPPPFDPSTLKPGAGRGDPLTGGIAIMPGAPGTAVPPGGAGDAPNAGGPLGGGRLPLPYGDMVGRLSPAQAAGAQNIISQFQSNPGAFNGSGPGGAPGIGSMDGQQLGAQGPGGAGNIDNAIGNLRSQLGMTGSLSEAPGTWGTGTNYMFGENVANQTRLGGGPTRPWIGGVSSGASPGMAPTGAGASPGTGPNFTKPLPANGAAGVAQFPNPYAALLRSRLAGGGGGGGLAPRTGPGVSGASLRGY